MSQSEQTIQLPNSRDEWEQWLCGLAKSPLTLLAHADDGVVWGTVTNTTLSLSVDAFEQLSPVWQQRTPQLKITLQQKTLQQLRLFNEREERLIWRDGDLFRQRHFVKNESSDTEYIERKYYLWGDRIATVMGSFNVLQEGERGLWHAPPIDEQSQGEYAHLTVRHYLNDDAMGQSYIFMSRLCALEWF